MSRDKGMMVLKEDLDREVVVIDKKKYIEKCLNLVHTESFIQLDYHCLKRVQI